jgi:hypothetical protein
MKKTVFTLCVDDYAPEIIALTFPLIRHYAEKIGADFFVITERMFPEWPVVYEKFQIYTLAREMGNDWNIFIDADALVHPDMADVTAHLRPDTVMQYAKDMSSVRWTQDEYMQRDGRCIASCNWFCVFSSLCLDVYHPLEDMTLAQAVANIYPVNEENVFGIRPDHLIDDYTVSRNIARYGLKYETWPEIQKPFGGPFFWMFHWFMRSDQEKLVMLNDVINTPSDVVCKSSIGTGRPPFMGWGLAREKYQLT